MVLSVRTSSSVLFALVVQLDCPSLSCGDWESVFLVIHQRIHSVTREILRLFGVPTSSSALYEAVVFPHLPANMVLQLFSYCFPDLVAFLPDEHEVINMSSMLQRPRDIQILSSLCVCVFLCLPVMDQSVSNNNKGHISRVASRAPSAL